VATRASDGFACARCAGCCTGTVVPLNGADLRRLVRKTGLAADRIVRLYDSSEVEFESDSPLWIRMRYGARVLGLRAQRDMRCMFLDEHGLCSVYDARPATCRTFPFMVELDDDGSLAENEMTSRLDCPAARIGVVLPEDVLHAARRETADDRAYAARLRALEGGDGLSGKHELLAGLGLA